jgi:hypothetical protein
MRNNIKKIKYLPLFTFFLFMGISSCSDSNIDIQPTRWTFYGGVRSLISYEWQIGNQNHSPIVALGIKDLTDENLIDLDGFIFYGVSPAENDFAYYNKKTERPRCGLTAMFKEGADSLVINNALTLDGIEIPSVINSGSDNIIPRYIMHNNWKDSVYTYLDSAILVITTPQNIEVIDTLRFRNDLLPLSINNGSGSKSKPDTFSIAQDLIVRWGNPVEGGYVTINFYISDGYYTTFVRTAQPIPDTGSYTFTVDQLEYYGAQSGDLIIFDVVRYDYHSRWFEQIQKTYGFLSYSQAWIACYLKG